MIDGVDIQDIKLASLQSNIGIAQQDVFLFNETIKDNILYGDFNATEQEIVEAAKKDNAHQFIPILILDEAKEVVF